MASSGIVIVLFICLIRLSSDALELDRNGVGLKCVF